MYGEWWIETRKRPNLRPPRRTAAGNLLDEGMSGWRLETIGPIGPGTIHDPFGNEVDEFFRQAHTIHGCDSENKMYSLLDCVLTDGRMQAPSVRGGVHHWRVGIIVAGTGVMVTPEAEIDQIDIRISDLELWAADARQRDFDHDPSAQNLSLDVQTHERWARIGDHELKVRWGRAWSANSARITASSDAVVQVAGPLKLLEINESWVRPVTRLVSLLTAQPVYVTAIQARLAQRDEYGHGVYVDVRIPQPIEEQPSPEPAADKAAQQIEMLASRRDLEDSSIDIEKLLASYFKVQADDNLRDALRHLIDSQAKTSGFRFDDSLLYGFNSFESYHGAVHEGGEAVGRDVAKLYDDLMCHVPRKHKALVKDRLNKKPPKSFLQMLDDVMSDCGATATTIRSAHPDVARSLRDLRNTIAHTNQGNLDLRERVDLLSTLHWIMRRVLLQAFGIPSDACDQLLAKNHVFNGHIRSIRSRYHPSQP